MSGASVSRTRWRPRAVPLRLRADDRLASDAANGDTEAFAALYERHHQPLYRYCRSIVADPDDAADALQSTMTRALAAIDARDPAAPVRAWLFRIAHNESISLVRRRRPTEILDADALVGPDVEADADRRSRLADLVRDLRGLSERQRGALLMREVSGLAHAEIAAAFEVSEGAVKQSIYEARVALQDIAEGREMSCATVRRELSDGDGRTARSRRLRGHLRSCEHCRHFRDGLKARRTELAIIVPLLPAGAAAAVLEAVIGAGVGGGGGGLLAGLVGGGAAKTVAVGAATVTAGAGAVSYTAVAPRDAEPPARTPARVVEAVKAERAGPQTRGPVRVTAVAAPDRDESSAGDESSARRESSGRRRSSGRDESSGDEDEDEDEREPSERNESFGRDEEDEEDRDSSGSGSGDEEDRGSGSGDEEDRDSSGSGSGDEESDSSGSGSGHEEESAEVAEADHDEPEKSNEH